MIIARLDDEFMQLQSEYSDWLMAEWTQDPDNDPEGYAEAYAVASDVLDNLARDKEMEDLAFAYLSSYFCSCDVLFIFDESQLDVGFEVMEQTEDSFTVKYLEIQKEGPVGSTPGTETMQYVKEDGVWKYNGLEFTSAEEQPLNLTYEDLKDSYVTPETGEVMNQS